MTYEKYNRASVLAEVEKLIAELEGKKRQRIEKEAKYVEEHRNEMTTWSRLYRIERAKKQRVRVLIRNVYEQLSIFDWWNDYISVSQLKQMRSFLIKAGELGFNGYVCFKVGSIGCSHGMWANKKESTDGYSPDGACLHHSFVSNYNYWDCCNEDGVWMGMNDLDEHGHRNRWQFTLKEVKEYIASWGKEN